MFEPIMHIFDFLGLSKTQETHQNRKPMAVPVENDLKNLQTCKNLFADLDAAEAEVINEISDTETAWKLLSRIRQLRRETYQDMLSMLPPGSIQATECLDDTDPVRAVKTQSGAVSSVFNGGRCH
jgi:hypothetical protein